MLTDSGPMSAIEQLLKVARAYGAAEGVPLSTVSSRALNDGKRLNALEEGADITVGRMESALRWFSEKWPATAEWPEDVPRPVAAEARA